MFIGDGAKLVRDAFNLAKEKSPSIIFIDELDAIGTKRFDSEKSGDREVQRTMLELINQLDGFDPRGNIKILMATNRQVDITENINNKYYNIIKCFLLIQTYIIRPDTLDPALLRPGRIDRKVEFSLPDLEVPI